MRGRAGHLPLQPVDIAVGANLRVWRQRRGMTLAVLAPQLGMSESMLSKVENGHTRLRLDLLVQAAALLRVSPARLLRMPCADAA